MLRTGLMELVLHRIQCPWLKEIRWSANKHWKGFQILNCGREYIFLTLATIPGRMGSRIRSSGCFATLEIFQKNKQTNRCVFMKIISIYYRNEFLHLINLGKRLEAMLQGEQTEQHRAASPAQSLRLLL